MARPPENGHSSKQGNHKQGTERRKSRKPESAKGGRNRIVRENDTVKTSSGYSFFRVFALSRFRDSFSPYASVSEMVAFAIV
jgi:hypothetical protein